MRIPGKVMLIHEADAARERMGAAFKHVGIEPLLRSTPIGAQALILRERPDVVVIEAAMPLMSGAEFTRALRAHPTLRHTIVLLSSPSAGSGVTPIARECGADGSVVHADLDELVRTVQGWIARKTMRPAASAQHGYVLVACGLAPGRELGTEMQNHLAARVTDSGTEVLRLLFARDAPALLLLGTAVDDVAPKKVFDTAVELDRSWAHRVLVVRERERDAAERWAEGLATITPTMAVADVLALVARIRGAP